MEIKSYDRKQLQDFIDSDFFGVLTQIPISYQRAISQINNPYSAVNDILLWAAFEENSLVGYVGVLPDIIEFESSKSKIYWLSCFWVDKAYRNGNLASQLFFPLIKQYKNQLLISNFLFSLEKTYQNLGIFQPTKHNFGYTFYINFSFAEILLARFPKLKSVIPIYRLAEKYLNSVLKTRKLFHKKKKQDIDIVENKIFDNELQIFLNTFSTTNNSFVRNIDHFKWITTYPWVTIGKTDKESERYFFTSKSDKFEYRSLKIYNSDKIVGFVFLKIRDNNLSISYIYTEEKNIEYVVDYILEIVDTENLNTVTTFDEKLSTFLMKKRNRFIFIKNTKHPYIIPKKLEIASSFFQDGDGDSVFT